MSTPQPDSGLVPYAGPPTQRSRHAGLNAYLLAAKGWALYDIHDGMRLIRRLIDDPAEGAPRLSAAGLLYLERVWDRLQEEDVRRLRILYPGARG